MAFYVLGLGAAVVAGGAYLTKKYLAIRSTWRFDDIPDQRGKVVVVTGANAGIGYEFCRHMLRKKAHIVMACRSKERGQAALEALKKEYSNASIELRILDISNMDSIRVFAAEFLLDFSRLDILVNNAGIGMRKPELVDGVEATVSTNCMGPFLLTGLLLPLLDKTSEARIVTVSSFAHRAATNLSRAELGDISKADFNWMDQVYRFSKAMNLAFSLKLAKVLEQRGSKTLSIAAHPGFAKSDFQSNIEDSRSRAIGTFLNNCLAQSTEMGAAPLLMAATDLSVQNGEFFGPCGIIDTEGWPTRNAVLGICNDPKFLDEQWKWSEEWTGFKY